MAEVWLYSLVSVFVVSAISLVGVFTLTLQQDRLQRTLSHLVSFSVGALLGDVFLHMFPEMMEAGHALRQGTYILAGILVFFVLEKLIRWHHSHTEHEEKIHSVVYLVLVGDGLHNFIDGVVIASSFLVDVHLGLVTTLAVIFHEVPQEVGDFAVLMHGGWKSGKALWANFLSGLTAVLGAVVVLVFSNQLSAAPEILLSLAAASFIYIAMSDLIPELHEEVGMKGSLIQFASMGMGVAVMALFLLLE